jgi:Rhodanese-like domain
MKSAKELIAAASARVTTISPEEAVGLLNEPNTIFVDLRDDSELARDGKIPGSVHVTRGMLEFALDPTLPYRRRRALRVGGGYGAVHGTGERRSPGWGISRLEGR